jgi:hypothetical protein
MIELIQFFELDARILKWTTWDEERLSLTNLLARIEKKKRRNWLERVFINLLERKWFVLSSLWSLLCFRLLPARFMFRSLIFHFSFATCSDDSHILIWRWIILIELIWWFQSLLRNSIFIKTRNFINKLTT